MWSLNNQSGRVAAAHSTGVCTYIVLGVHISLAHEQCPGNLGELGPVQWSLIELHTEKCHSYQNIVQQHWGAQHRGLVLTWSMAFTSALASSSARVTSQALTLSSGPQASLKQCSAVSLSCTHRYRTQHGCCHTLTPQHAHTARVSNATQHTQADPGFRSGGI